MANEARVFAEGPDHCLVRSVTVAASVAVPKGTLLVSVEGSSRYGVAHTAAARTPPLGFTTMSKATTDADYASATNVGVQRTGVVVATVDGAVKTGQLLFASNTTANRLQACFNGQLSIYETAQLICARAIEDIATGAAGKVALINLG